MIVEVDVKLILETPGSYNETAELIERELKLRNLVAGRVCEVRASAWPADESDVRRFSGGRSE